MTLATGSKLGPYEILGQTYAYGSSRILSDLYIAEGLK
jgi:hypothetical protein